jgi:hypothetical protein
MLPRRGIAGNASLWSKEINAEDALLTRGQFIPKGAVGARLAIRALHRGTHLALLADQK